MPTHKQPMFAKRHYETIAAAFRARRAPPECSPAVQAAWRVALRSAASVLCDAFQADNPAFDRARFMQACNL